MGNINPLKGFLLVFTDSHRVTGIHTFLYNPSVLSEI
jgi:hypothetical protein